jgi:hypothetical protein
MNTGSPSWSPSCRDLVARHLVPLRSFLVGLTSTLFVFVTGALALY